MPASTYAYVATGLAASVKAQSLGHGLPPGRSSHHPREASGGAFTQFTPQQIKQFKEAFSMIDQDGDGRVTEGDLKVMLSNLGQTPTPSLLSRLLTTPSGTRSDSINFTQFLTMMGDHLRQLDAEADLVEAFACFDEEDKGWVDVGVVRKYLAEMGDRMDQAEKGGSSGSSEGIDRRSWCLVWSFEGRTDGSIESAVGAGPASVVGWGHHDDMIIDRLFSGPFTDRQGRFHYIDFAKVLRVSEGEEERDDKLAM
ncbi:hypothetical protein EHS25_002948 [Saitozyma podzolica]|uniref:EF-hand domain-containing protein n=1 Tax=Saitozyma podzolica TaxID=1890683 RepID=A0A427YC29_9TREE|nr:hypothetical protein EHS25_002948 [Saitozyma podzolica]